MPELSVIVPVYKVEKYLSRCIDSILSQTYKDFELILVDDGSPDNCGKICDEYAEKDSRIKVIHKENGGLSDARNKGIDIMKGLFVTFVDSDDYIHSDMLSFMMKIIKSENADISVCAFKRTSNDSEEIFISEDFQAFTPSESVMQMYKSENSIAFITAWGKIYKASLWENLRFPKGKYHEDEFTTYKLLYSSAKTVFTKNQFYFYYTNPESIIQSSFKEKNIDGLDALSERISFFETKNETEILNSTKLALISSIMYSHQRLSREKSIKNKKYLKKKILSYLDITQKSNYVNTVRSKQKLWAKLFFFSPDLYSFLRNTFKIGL